MSLFPGDPPSPLSGLPCSAGGVPSLKTALPQTSAIHRLHGADPISPVPCPCHAFRCLPAPCSRVSPLCYPLPRPRAALLVCALPLRRFPFHCVSLPPPCISKPSEAKPLSGTSYRCFPLPCLSASPLISAKLRPLGPHPSRTQPFLVTASPIKALSWPTTSHQIAAAALHPIAHHNRCGPLHSIAITAYRGPPRIHAIHRPLLPRALPVPSSSQRCPSSPCVS